jgi:cytochrome c oxidase cbb3-type subunit 3
MSDFTSGFWNIYIIGITIVSIIACGVLLYMQSKVKVKPGGKGADTTGHVWDGDLEEYNNPLPKWWMNLFWITIVFSFVYLVLYPGLGTFQGVLGWSQTGQYDRERSEAEAKVKPLYDKFLAMDLAAVAADPQARGMGERIFLNNCAQCHGSDAGGARGFPNLRDGDWLYGGEPAQVVETITNGRMGVMPPQTEQLGGEEGVRNVVAYVRSLSGMTADPLKVQLGREKFTTVCAACHGADGKGNVAIGAPNLTDRTWLHGSTEAAITETVTKGRNMNVSEGTLAMPSFKDVLGPARIHLVAAYVHGLSKAPAAK